MSPNGSGARATGRMAAATAKQGPLRIAIVASHAPSLTIFRGPLIKRLVDMGHEVLCLAPDYTPDVLKEVAALGALARDYPLERTGLNPLADARSLKALHGQFRAWRPDVVMGYTPKPAIYASLAARLARTRRIVPMITGLGYAFLDGKGAKQAAVRGAMRRLYRLALSASHAVIFHNRDDYRMLKGLGGVPKRIETHVVAGSGVDLDHYPRVPLPPLDGGLTFLMIARLVRYKGVAEYCAAAAAVKRTAPTARFLLAGPEETGPASYPVTELDAFKDVVEYLGPAKDVRPLYARAHVYVLPSYGEGMPRTVLEAMASGRPIITTDARGCRETVDERVNGCLVPIGNADALSEAMLSFLRRPDLLPSMAQASRLKAERRFDVRRVNEEMLEALLGAYTSA